MMNILDNEAAMAVLRDANIKLSDLGFKSLISPCAFDSYGMTLSLHVAETDSAVAAACVAQSQGGAVAHTEAKLFSSEVEDFMVDIASLDLPKAN
jgi:hypothetical protein